MLGDIFLSTWKSRALIVFLGLLAALAPVSTDMYLPALPEFSADLHISASEAQLTLTMTMIGMAVGQVLGGPVSDYWGRKKPLLIGMICFMAVSAACVFVSSIHVFLLLRLVQGLAGAFGIVIGRAIARDVADGPQLMRYMAVLMMVNGLAPILAPVLGGQVLRFTSWHGIFVAMALIGAFMVLGSLIYRETLPKENRAAGVLSSFKSFPVLMKSRYFVGHCLVQCFVFGGFFTYIGGSTFLFQTMYHVSPQGFSYIFGGIGLGLLFMGSLPARMAGAVRSVVMLAQALKAQLAGSILFLAGVLLHAPIWYIIASLFITVVPLSVIGTASNAMALNRCGENAGSASAILGFSSMILGAILMPIAGLGGGSTALPMAVIMCACFAAAWITFKKYISPEHIREVPKPGEK
jgi:DHA1 family bicyclomycin/chloramphenicol resistance-like MFS transporter